MRAVLVLRFHAIERRGTKRLSRLELLEGKAGERAFRVRRKDVKGVAKERLRLKSARCADIESLDPQHLCKKQSCNLSWGGGDRIPGAL